LCIWASTRWRAASSFATSPESRSAFASASADDTACLSASSSFPSFVGERLLDPVDQAVELVLLLDQRAAGRVCAGVGLGFLHHPIDFGGIEPPRTLDPDRLDLARSLVLRPDREDPVRVDVERDLDLRDATR